MDIHVIQVSNKKDPKEAREIAQKFIKDDKKTFMRETDNFYRFRAIPKTKFVKNSYRSKKINDDIIITYGRLKPEFKHLSGGGLFSDFFRHPIDTIKHVFSQASKLNNESTKTLEEFGNRPIVLMQIARTPLNQIIPTALNVVSFGQYNKVKDKLGYDKLYHLSLLLTLNDGVKVIVEKNEVIKLSTNLSSLNNQTVYMNVDLMGKQLTLNDLIERTKALMGDVNFYEYDGFTNNCQIFIDQILNAAGLNKPQYHEFLFQDLTQLKENLPSYVPAVARKITDIRGIISRLMGKGKKNKNKGMKKFNEYMLDKTYKDEDELAKMFVEFFENSEFV